MTTLDTTDLEDLANISFSSYEALYLIGQNRAEEYYAKLEDEANAAGLLHVENYAVFSRRIVDDYSTNGIFANIFTSSIAAANSVNYSTGGENRLRVQYELMRADIAARLADISGSGTGELTFQDTLDVHGTALGSIGLPPEAFVLYTPLAP